jgi:hypothetical protein
MSDRTAARLAWSLCAVCVVLIAPTILLDFVTAESHPILLPGERPAPGLGVLMGVLSLAYPTVGALIASRLPANLIGWIFCGMGLLYAAQRLTTAYADYALLENIALPGGEFVAWFSTCVGFPGLILAVVFLMLLFPDGRLPSRRWRIVAWAALLGAASVALGVAFMPGPLLNHHYVENPFGVVGVIGGRITTYDLFVASIVLGLTLLLMSNLAALFSLILRLRHARGDERQQLKWFLYAAVPLTTFLSLIVLDLTGANFTANFGVRPIHILQTWWVFRDVLYAAVVALLLLPVCTYIAILKHRLYDIDVIINRTLVYGAMTVVIAGIVEAVDAAVHHLFLVLTHQESILSVIVSALAIAALFDPLKHRIQHFVDRRIFRAEKVTESEKSKPATKKPKTPQNQTQENGRGINLQSPG